MPALRKPAVMSGHFVWRDRPRAKNSKTKKNTVEVEISVHAIVYGGLSPDKIVREERGFEEPKR